MLSFTNQCVCSFSDIVIDQVYLHNLIQALNKNVGGNRMHKPSTHKFGK
jgi:hypothetical protein